MKDRESRQGGRQAYHLCVGGHKLKEEKKKKMKKKGSKIKREEAERKEGEEKRKESGQRVKWISGCFNLKNRTEGNQKHLTWYKSIIQRKMLLRCRYEWRSNVADLWGWGARIETLLIKVHTTKTWPQSHSVTLNPLSWESNGDGWAFN